MSERLRSLTDDELGAELSMLDVAWPSEPDLAPLVMASVRTARRPRVVRLPLSRTKRILLIAAATVLLLAGAALAAKFVIDLGAVVVQYTPGPSGALPTPSAAPAGERVTLRQAADLLGRPLEFPAALGAPDEVWADEIFTETGDATRVTMAWLPAAERPAISGTRFGAVLMVFEGDANQASKDIYEDTGVLQVETVEGTEYYWTTGTHVLELLTREGVVFVRVEGNVLLWRDGPYTMRLETSLPKAETIRIAASVGTP
jgi:hypothetical protein